MGLSGHFDYWRRAIRKAWENTWSSFGSSPKSLFQNFIIFVVALLLLPKYGGAKEVIGEARWVLVVIQAGIGVFALTFLAHLLAAPSHLEHDKEVAHDSERKTLNKTIDGLTERLDEKSHRESILYSLGAFLLTVVLLLHEPIENGEEYEEWGQSVKNWLNASQKYLLENVSHVDSIVFGITSIREEVEFANRYDERHNLDLNHLFRQYENLKEIIDKVRRGELIAPPASDTEDSPNQ